jgi:hypothetical protein
MNELNYATLEASQRLQKSGIVLETEVDWHHVVGGDWYLLPHKSVKSNEFDEIIPAVHFAEVWRELPDNDHAIIASKRGGTTQVKYCCINKRFSSTNPTDCLIDLLIWTVEQEGGGK